MGRGGHGAEEKQERWAGDKEQRGPRNWVGSEDLAKTTIGWDHALPLDGAVGPASVESQPCSEPRTPIFPSGAFVYLGRV